MAFPYNLADTPAEIMESETGVILVERREYAVNSGGPGKFRGGLGQRIDLRIRPGSVSKLLFSVWHGRYRRGPGGLLGGEPGGRGAVYLNGAHVPAEQHDLEVNSGDLIGLLLPGGGGMHSPLERDPALVEADVRRGYVSAEAARTDYGWHP